MQQHKTLVMTALIRLLQSNQDQVDGYLMFNILLTAAVISEYNNMLQVTSLIHHFCRHEEDCEDEDEGTMKAEIRKTEFLAVDKA